MPAFNKFNLFVQDLEEGIHNFKTGSTAVYKVILIPTTAPVATNHVYADISANELATANGYTAGGAPVTITDSNSLGTETVSGTSVTWTATGGSIAARYAVLYRSDDTNKELVGWWDYGVGGFTVTAGNQLTISWPSGIFTLA